MIPKVKICGMKHNIAEIATLQPDYLGFIFYEGSRRNYDGPDVAVPLGTKKVGVFVNADVETILKKLNLHDLNVIQLHGDESATYTKQLRALLNQNGYNDVILWKVFSVGESFDFRALTPYEDYINAFLFDTQGELRGGNGVAFNWDLLKNYHSNIPIVLSGGIGPDHIEAIKKIISQGSLPLLAIDVNSKFESEPGRKNRAALKIFMDELQC